MVPFFKEGIDRGEKAFYVSECEMRTHLLQTLSLAGIDVSLAEKRGLLETKKWEEIYIREGRFDQDAMLVLIQDVLSQGREQGSALTRFVARMEWVIKYGMGLNELLEYEARLNQILPKFPDPVICVYDLAKFTAGSVMDILRTHPMVIIGGLMAENPFFVAPDLFLQELSERGAYTRQKTAPSGRA